MPDDDNSEKHAGGRPSLYREEYIDQLLEYFGKPPYREEIQKIHLKNGDTRTKVVIVANDFPSLAGFAISIGVSRDTLLEWSKVHPEFSGAYKRVKEFQENFLAVNGNKNLISTAFGIFTAKNVVGWRDRQPDEVDVVINNNNMSDEQLDQRIKSLSEKLVKKES